MLGDAMMVASVIFYTIGMICLPWFFLWFAWDKRSTGPGVLIGIAAVSLFAGWLMEKLA